MRDRATDLSELELRIEKLRRELDEIVGDEGQNEASQGEGKGESFGMRASLGTWGKSSKAWMIYMFGMLFVVLGVG